MGMMMGSEVVMWKRRMVLDCCNMGGIACSITVEFISRKIIYDVR